MSLSLTLSLAFILAFGELKRNSAGVEYGRRKSEVGSRNDNSGVRRGGRNGDWDGEVDGEV